MRHILMSNDNRGGRSTGKASQGAQINLSLMIDAMATKIKGGDGLTRQCYADFYLIHTLNPFELNK